MREDIDWLTLQKEYIEGNIGQEKLANKHGIPYKTLRARAAAEHWADLRADYRQKLGPKLTEALLEDRLKKIDRVADGLMEKLTKAVKQLDKRPVIVREHTVKPDGSEKFKQRVIYERGSQIDRQGLKTLVSALKDLQAVVRAGQTGGGQNITVTFKNPDNEELSD